jgi:hypothetical protein
MYRKGDNSHDVPQRILQHGLLWLLPLSQEPISRGRRQTIRLGVKEQFREIFEDPKIYCNSVGIGFFYSICSSRSFLGKKSYFKCKHFFLILIFSNIFLFDAAIMDIFKLTKIFAHIRMYYGKNFQIHY